MRKPILLLLLLGCAACGERSSNASGPQSSTYISIEGPKQGWAESIQYRNEGGETRLVMDGVEFDLRDPAAYRLDWGALGMEGIEVTGSLKYESNKPVEGALLAVSGREVRIVDGDLMWGDEKVGAVEEGDRVIVDADGLRLE